MRDGEVLVISREVEPEVWMLQDTVVLDFFAPTRHDWRNVRRSISKGSKHLAANEPLFQAPPGRQAPCSNSRVT